VTFAHDDAWYAREAQEIRDDLADRRAAAASVTSPCESEDALTEVGAAERFARLHGDHVRFDHRRQRWLLWSGHRWADDEDGGIQRIAIEFARNWQQETLDIRGAEREKTIKFALKLERKYTIGNMLALARNLPPIADKGDRWNADPWLLGVPNGVVDLRTGELRRGRPEDGITLQTSVPYDAFAPCVRWERFIREVFAGDDALIDFIVRAIGYSITGITSEQVLFFGYGVGANGKGTLTNTLKHVLGDYAWNMPFSTLELRDRSSIPNDLAALASRRVVVASETNDGVRLNEARVKALTGCDPITARFLHAEFFTFDPVAKFWLSANHKPIVRDDSYGFWRRIRLIPFRQRFAVDPTLKRQLEDEATGILAWCVRGALAWQEQGLCPPSAVTEATQEYEADSDALAAFLSESCEVDPQAQIGARDLHEHYRAWAIHHGLSERERLSATAFGRKVAERFERVKGRRGNTYRGIALGPAEGFSK
jgi:putative DNA primase/helicase